MPTTDSDVSIDVPELEDTSSIAAESISTVLMPEVVPIDVLPRKRHITYDVTESIVILEQDIPKEKGRWIYGIWFFCVPKEKVICVIWN